MTKLEVNRVFVARGWGGRKGEGEIAALSQIETIKTSGDIKI